MKVVFDTNVVLDVLLDRKPHAALAAQLFALVEQGGVEGLLGATTVTTVHYIASKTVGREKARTQVETLLGIFGIAGIRKSTLLEATQSDLHDFEDAVLLHAAIEAAADCIVTRDRDDFERASIPVFSPLELLAAIQSQQPDKG